ncbi:hypothetical protein FKM82_017694 [Ascaphus truei]
MYIQTAVYKASPLPLTHTKGVVHYGLIVLIRYYCTTPFPPLDLNGKFHVVVPNRATDWGREGQVPCPPLPPHLDLGKHNPSPLQQPPQPPTHNHRSSVLGPGKAVGSRPCPDSALLHHNQLPP